jgi:hypothetical protein
LGIVEEGISFITNFLTQILTIIAATVLGARYVISENRKGRQELSKRILGPEQDAKLGKGGYIDDLRSELRAEFKRDIENLRTELVNMITESHRELINEFRRTSTKISYMSRDFGRMEKSLEKMSSGRYIAARDETVKEEQYDYVEFEDYEDNKNTQNSDNKNRTSFNTDDFNKKYRKGRKE